MWVSNDGYCSYMYLDIKKYGSESVYGTDSDDKGCSQKHWKGKSRMTNSKLYIGITQFEILEEPILIETLDTMGYLNRKGRVKAKMKLKNSVFHGRNIFTFYKTIDY